MATTTALVHREAKGHSKMETIKLEPLRDDEALIDIQASGVCHTDLHCMEGALPAQFPAVFGHEGSGTVVEVGSKVTSCAPGDKVLLSYAHCLSCPSCTHRMPAYCHQFMPLNFGGGRADGSATMTIADGGARCSGHFFGQSSFAKRAIAHVSSIVKVPADTDISLYAPLGCGLQTGAGAVLNTLDMKTGATIAVYGAGSVGLSAIMAAKIRGASKIIAVDLFPSRLELAKDVGATDVIDGSADDVVDQIRKLCPPYGTDYGVDCTGVPKVVENMIEALGTKGAAAGVGAPPPGSKAAVDVLNQSLFGRKYMGCVEGDSITSEFIPYLIEEHKKGNFPFDKFVKFYKAEDFEKAFEDMHKGETVKGILTW